MTHWDSTALCLCGKEVEDQHVLSASIFCGQICMSVRLSVTNRAGSALW